MPRFVILEHDHPNLHWDLMLESGGVLRTWRLLQSPETRGPIEAEAIGDHRPQYLHYEGPVSGGRGSVKRWDGGEYTLVLESPDRLEIQFAGARLSERCLLEQAVDGSRWSLHRLNEPSTPSPT